MGKVLAIVSAERPGQERGVIEHGNASPPVQRATGPEKGARPQWGMESRGAVAQLQSERARGQVAAEHIDSHLPGSIGLTAIDQHVFAGLADQFPSMAANR